MSLKLKTLLILAASIILMIVLVVGVTSKIFLDGFKEYEQKATFQDLQRVIKALQDEIANLNLTTKDWANWDDTYEFVQNGNDQYKKVNLGVNSLAIIKVNAAAYINNSREIVFASGIDFEEKRKTEFPKQLLEKIKSEKLLTQHENPQGFVAGIILLAEGPMLIASRPILTSESEGPIQGTLIFGRFLGAEMSKKLSEQTQLSIDFKNYYSKNLPLDFQQIKNDLSLQSSIVTRVQSRKIINGFALMPDIFGKPALILSVSIPRNIYEQGQASINYLIIILVVLSAGFLFFTLFLLDRLFLSRLSRLDFEVRNIKNNEDQKKQITIKGSDELSRLSKAINEMLDRIEFSNKQLEESEARMRYTQKMEAIGRLAGGIAHDFNNLLTGIIGYSDILIRDFSGNQSARKNLEEIKNAGEKAALLTRQLLAFSRKQVMAPRVIDLNTVISDMQKFLKSLLGEASELVIILDKKLNNVIADPAQIEQVIINLVMNSKDAMPEGGKLIIETVNVELDEYYASQHVDLKAGSYVVLTVSDTGIGIAKKDIARIFEPFFSTKEKGKGSGLGLSTVYGIIKQSGGNIVAYSEPEFGTTIKIYLPAVKGQKIEEKMESSYAASNKDRYVVLLVEDEEMVRRLTKEVLTRNGLRVIEAGNGMEAQSQAENYNGEIDLMITDVIMPKMNGIDLAEKIKLQRPGMKVLFMSGYSDNNQLYEEKMKPGYSFLQKPFTPEILYRKVAEMLSLNISKKTI